MNYKENQLTQERISVLGVGTWSMGGTNKFGLSYGNVEEQASIEAIHTLIKNGVNLIDTAPVYGADSASEKVVGIALQGGYREKVKIVTKFGNVNDPQTGKRVINNSYDTIMKECEESLQRLQTDYIDYYLMHYPDPNVPIEETMRALNELKLAGKILHIGLSNPTQELILEAEQYGQIEAIQLPYSMVNRQQEELFKWCHNRGYFTMSYGSLGASILSGAYRELPHFDEKDIRYTFYPFFKDPMFSDIQCLLKEMDKIAHIHHVPVSHIALNWVTQKDFISASLVGVANQDQAQENSQAFAFSLTDEEMLFLDHAIEKYL